MKSRRAFLGSRREWGNNKESDDLFLGELSCCLLSKAIAVKNVACWMVSMAMPLPGIAEIRLIRCKALKKNFWNAIYRTEGD
ncbi:MULTISPECIES: hypothetical protein [unclassified Fibrobacter]|uniref:hypothetical protein n=1 Tax=unclassified Fibrobacter TaxID=2634177 RepID=UPI001114BB69|nr:MULTISPECIES: hypothetical protein [unclassified Fibrobacter]